MAKSKQELLREAWLGEREGNMSAQQEARAWALRETWKEEHGDKTYGMLPHIANKVYKVAKKKKEHPTSSALSQLFQKIDNDKGWFPGKSEQVKHGPAPAINGTNQGIIARTAMTMKDNGKEVTYPKLVAHTPKASKNPTTNRPVTKKVIYNVLRKHCYDDANNPEDTWTHDHRYSETALTDSQMKARHKWALEAPADLRKPQWCYRNLIWTDICNSILPNTQKMHKKQIAARKGKKGWGSKKTKRKSMNLRGDKAAIKQKSWGTKKVWWAPILTRGKLHIEIIGQSFPGETAAGAAVLVDHVRKAVNLRFRSADKPKILFTDRGQGFYEKFAHATITPEYKAALRENSFKAYYGDDAKALPGRLQEVYLHETAVSWVRFQEEQTRPKEPWSETVPLFSKRMRDICLDINKRLDVDGLCRSLPKRLKNLVDAEGDRISTKYSAHQH